MSRSQYGSVFGSAALHLRSQLMAESGTVSAVPSAFTLCLLIDVSGVLCDAVRVWTVLCLGRYASLESVDGGNPAPLLHCHLPPCPPSLILMILLRWPMHAQCMARGAGFREWAHVRWSPLGHGNINGGVEGREPHWTAGGAGLMPHTVV